MIELFDKQAPFKFFQQFKTERFLHITCIYDCIYDCSAFFRKKMYFLINH